MKKFVIRYNPGCCGEAIASLWLAHNNIAPLSPITNTNRHESSSDAVKAFHFRQALKGQLTAKDRGWSEIKPDITPNTQIYATHILTLNMIARLYKNNFDKLLWIKDDGLMMIHNPGSNVLFHHKVRREIATLEETNKYLLEYSYRLPVIEDNILVDYAKKAFKIKYVDFKDIMDYNGIDIIEDFYETNFDNNIKNWWISYIDKNEKILNEYV